MNSQRQRHDEVHDARHQSSGRQVGGIPAIIGHPADQFVALMITYRDKQRDNQVMQTIAGRIAAM